MSDIASLEDDSRAPPEAEPRDAGRGIIDLRPVGNGSALNRSQSKGSINLDTTYESSEGIDNIQQGVPAASELTAARRLLTLQSALLVLPTLGVLISGCLLMNVYFTGIPDFTIGLYVWSTIMALKAGIEVTAMLLCPADRWSYLLSAIDSLGRLSLIQAFLLYLTGQCSDWTLIGLLALSVVAQLIKIIVLGFARRPVGLAVGLIECFTLLLVGAKIASPESLGPWSLILAPYTFLYYALIFLNVASTIAVVALFAYFLGGQAGGRKVSGPQLGLALVAHTVVLVGSAMLCCLYLGVRQLLEAKAIVPLPTAKVNMPGELLLASYLMIAFAVYSLSIILLSSFFFKSTLLRLLSFEPSEGAWLAKCAAALKPALKALSGGYFKKRPGEGIDVSEQGWATDAPLDECVVCQTMPSSFLFHPCNHFAVCADCVRQFLESQAKCPICKAKIDTCSHIIFDENKNSYVVDYPYKLESF